MSGALGRAGGEADKAKGRIESFDDIMGSLNLSTVAGMAGIGALVGAFQKLASVVAGTLKSSIQAFAQFEGLQKSLNVTLGDSVGAMTEFEELKRYANATPYTVTGLADVASQLHSVGIGAQEAMELLKRFGDVALGDADKMNRIAANYAQIVSVGKTSSVDIKQFAMMGIPIYDTLQKIGVEGNATAEQIKQAFTLMTDEGGKFYNGMAAGADSLNVMFNQLDGATQSLVASLGALFVDEAKAGLQAFTEAIVKVNEIMDGLNNHPLLKYLIAGTLAGALTGIAAAMVQSLVPALMKLLVQLGLVNGQLTIMAILKSIFDPKTLGIALAVGAVAGLAAGITKVIGKYRDMKDAENEALKTDEEKAAEEKAKGIVASYNSIIEARRNLAKEINGPLGIDTLSDYDKFSSALDAMRQKLIDMQTMKQNAMTMDGEAMDMDDLAELDRQYESYLGLYKTEQRIFDATKTRLLAEKEVTAELERQKTAGQDVLARAMSAYEKSDEYKRRFREQEIARIQDMLNRRESYVIPGTSSARGTRFMYRDEGDRQERTALLAYLDELKKELMPKVKETWQEVFERITEIDVSDLASGDLATRRYADYYRASVRKQEAEADERDPFGLYQKAMGLKSGNKYAQPISSVSDTYEKLQKQLDEYRDKRSALLSDESKTFEERDRAIQEFDSMIASTTDSIRMYSDKLVDLTEKSELLNAALGGFQGIGEYISKQAAKNYNGSNGFSTAMQGVGGTVLQQVGSGTNVGAMAQGAIQGAQTAGPWGAIIGALAALVVKLERFSDLMDAMDRSVEPLIPVLEEIIGFAINLIDSVQVFIDLLKPYMSLITNVVKVLNSLWRGFNKGLEIAAKALDPFAYFIEVAADAVGGFAKAVLDFFDIDRDKDDSKQEDIWKKYTEYISEQAKLTEALNRQLELMNGTIKDQITYYYDMQKAMSNTFLNQRVEAGSMMRTTKVNDMILTPHGQFSTAPDDYIIATKTPGSLGGNGSATVQMNVTVNNTVSDMVRADTRTVERQDGTKELVVMISRAVAGDMARGANGWDDAMSYRESRIRGRRLS